MKKVQIKGTIIANEDKWIYEWFKMDATCPRDVETALNEANGEDVLVTINSGGGDVFAGNEIYYLINTYQGKVTIDIIGFAGSAATIIAMAGKHTRMIPTAMFMIHNVSGSARGDYNAMDKSSQVLRTANSAISNAYRIKTGMSEDELLELMNKETWLTASEAKEKGFIDEIINDTGNKEEEKTFKNLYNSSFCNILSKETIEKIRNTIKDPLKDNESSSNKGNLLDDKLEMKKLQAQTRLRLMNLERMMLND